jgi:hypothetical protein
MRAAVDSKPVIRYGFQHLRGDVDRIDRLDQWKVDDHLVDTGSDDRGRFSVASCGRDDHAITNVTVVVVVRTFLAGRRLRRHSGTNRLVIARCA